ncbi:MAG: tetraacyldisaccharide 4'-kinase [Bacteroidales bacterium]|jgi:tetraacyldisaccharide 4'-kinase|nr:tetraacyldisaccharide 4'-kinase [Bacteroidales bacterium]
MTFARVILWPFSLLYGLVTAVRNKCYDWGWLPSIRFDDVEVVCVGNITTGGTGKTPHVEYLIRTLSPHCRLAVLSRGYKRKTKGFVLATTASTAQDVGDEPCQIKRKYQDIPVAVDTDRRRGIRQLKTLYPSLQIILLDDAFQHRRVTPSFSFLLADYRRPLYRDGMLPGGRLREWTCFARRADVLIITKSPENISTEERENLRRKYASIFSGEILFSIIRYETPAPVFQNVPPLDETRLARAHVLLLTGIAHPQPLEDHVHRLSACMQAVTFGDHHRYTPSDIDAIMKKWEQWADMDEKYVLTTEKDAMRLQMTDIPDSLQKALFYIPVKVEFLEGQAPEKRINRKYRESL